MIITERTYSIADFVTAYKTQFSAIPGLEQEITLLQAAAAYYDSQPVAWHTKGTLSFFFGGGKEG